MIMNFEKKITDDLYEDLKNILENYSYATNINCKIFDNNGDIIMQSNFPKNHQFFCEMIHDNHPSNVCKLSYAHGVMESEKYGETYIYFCPYGLINWVAPIVRNDVTNLYLVAGPVLIHQIDNFLIDNILQLSPSLRGAEDELKKVLEQVTEVPTGKVKYLADLLLRLSKAISDTDYLKLSELRESNLFKSQIADNISTLKKTDAIYGKDISSNLVDKENLIISSVKSGDLEGAKVILQQLMAHIFYFNSDNMDILKWKTSQLIIILAQVFCELGAMTDEITKMKLKYLEKVFQANNINELSINMLKVFDHYCNSTYPILNIKNREMVLVAINYIRNNFHNSITLYDVASEVGIHHVNLSKLFKKETGKTFTDYLNFIRIEASKELLRKNLPIADIALLVGYNDQSYFSKIFRKIQGTSPKEWTRENSRE